jgi:hypothetical protein
MANHHPHAMAYAPMDRTIVPPVLKMTGKNLRTGRMMNFTFAPNLRSRIPTAPKDASHFFSLPASGDSVGAGG